MAYRSAADQQRQIQVSPPTTSLVAFIAVGCCWMVVPSTPRRSQVPLRWGSRRHRTKCPPARRPRTRCVQDTPSHSAGVRRKLFHLAMCSFASQRHTIQSGADLRVTRLAPTSPRWRRERGLLRRWKPREAHRSSRPASRRCSRRSSRRPLRAGRTGRDMAAGSRTPRLGSSHQGRANTGAPITLALVCFDTAATSDMWSQWPCPIKIASARFT